MKFPFRIEAPPAAKIFTPLAFLLALTSCTSLPLKRTELDRQSEETRKAIVGYARGLLGRKDLESSNPRFRNDCSGYVLGVFGETGHAVDLGGVPPSRTLSDTLYRALNARGCTYVDFKPRPADLVFFKGTTGKRSDLVTHVGIVDGVLGDGTVLIVHYSSGSVSELRMNLMHPSVHRDGEGTVVNDFLRRKLPADGQGARLLSGELFFSFGDALAYTLSTKPHIVFE